jgi:hypothetical protein
MICLHCSTLIRYVWVLSWWACACRVWATDEQHTRQAQ